jgi:hypothetical protein
MMRVRRCPFSILVCFQEADRSPLEEDVLIRMAGDEDSYADFVMRQTFEKSAIPKSR